VRRASSTSSAGTSTPAEPLDLADAEERFRSAFESSRTGMAVTALDGRLVRVNAALARMVGRTVDELVGMRVAEISHPDEREADLDTIRRLIADPTQDVCRQKRYVRPGGREVWAMLTVSAVAGPDGATRCLIAQMIDVSEQRAAELALADSERRFRTLALASPVGIFAATADGRMMYANDRMGAIFGCPTAELDSDVWLARVAPRRARPLPLRVAPARACSGCRPRRSSATPRASWGSRPRATTLPPRPR
jgi:PAS domain S-box-containing protein